MSDAIRIRIDVKKIDESRLFVGEKGTYLNAVLFPTPDSEYGNDYVIREDITMEERNDGVKGAVLGNGRIMNGRGNGNRQNERTENQNGPSRREDPPEVEEENDDLPF